MVAPVAADSAAAFASTNAIRPSSKDGCVGVVALDFLHELIQLVAIRVHVTLEEKVLVRTLGLHMATGVVGHVRVGNVLHSQHSLRSKGLQALVETVSGVPRVADQHELIVASSQRNGRGVVIPETSDVFGELD